MIFYGREPLHLAFLGLFGYQESVMTCTLRSDEHRVASNNFEIYDVADYRWV